MEEVSISLSHHLIIDDPYANLDFGVNTETRVGRTLFPRPTTMADIVSMLAMSVPLIHFVEYTQPNKTSYRCRGRYHRNESNQWVLMRQPCTGVDMQSTNEIFERHIKRSHLRVERELGEGRFDLVRWASGESYFITRHHHAIISGILKTRSEASPIPLARHLST